MESATLTAWISIAIAIISIGVTITIAVVKRASKVLAYEAYTEFPLFFSDSPVAPDIQITANGSALDSPHVLIVTLKNTGNTEIRVEDFTEPVSIVFSDADLISLRAQVAPAGPRPDVEIETSQRFTLQPLVLNAGDGIVFYALLDGCPHRLHLHARVAGGTVRDMTNANGITQSLLADVRRRLLGQPPRARSRTPANNRVGPLDPSLRNQ